jgi:DNA-binding SARP family transcriptional activator
MNGQVTYHQQVSYCGKSQCRKCREGTGHGPYWYAYRTVEGKTTRTYVGKQLPPNVQASLSGMQNLQRPLSVPGEQVSIHVYTLGQFRLERRTGSEWETVTDAAWQNRSVRTLLGYLISSGARQLGREQLMDAVWPELDVETAGHRLDRAVYTLRQLFEPMRSKLATSPLLLTERELLVLADQSHIWVDTDAFETLMAQARTSTNPGETEHLLEEAALLYGGDFFPEERSNEWTLARREMLQRSWVSLLLELADLRIAHEALALAIDPLDRLLAHDPTNEAAVQRLMRLFAQLGRRGEALRAYKKLAAVLHQEYKIAPLPETRALYEAVRRGGDERSQPSQTHTEEIVQPPVSPSRTSSALIAHAGDTGVPKRSAPAHQPVLPIGRTHQSPLVGREQEMALLRDLIVTTENAVKFKLPGQKKGITAPFDAQRRPQSVLLMGEVGIGKTRLAEEVGREARQRGWAVAWSRVYAQEGSIPYRLWIDILRKALAQYGGIGFAPERSPTGIGHSQGASSPTAALPPQILQHALTYQPLATLLPELRAVLPEVSYPSPPSAEQEQLRLWEAVRELLSTICERMPLLIVLDDLQWADGSSYELLAYLARRLYGQSIVIIGTCRYNELAPDSSLRPLLTDLQRERSVETLTLSPLSNEQIRTLVSGLLAGTPNTSPATVNVPEPTVRRIQTRAAGNPFFAEELARTIASQPDGANLSHALDTPAPLPSLPETITAALDLRLSRLSSACQRLLSRAAVLGGTFEFPVIAAMEAGSSEDTVLDLLEEGLRSGMLSEEGIGSHVTYVFWHPLLVSHLYEGLSAARRASLHRRAAEILLRVYAPNEAEGAAIITHHLVHGGADADQIAYFAELAGDRAYALSAYSDAEHYYRIALVHMSQHPDEQSRKAYMLELLGECTRLQGKNEEARHFYEQALEVRRQHRALASALEQQQEVQVDALLWCEIGLTWYDTGDNVQARQCYERGEQVLREAGVIAGPVWASLRYLQSYAYWREGNYDEARSKAHEALKLFEQVTGRQSHTVEYAARSTYIRRTLVGDPVDLGRTYVLLGIIDSSAGRSTDALVHLKTALTLYEQYNRQREIASVCCNLGDLYLRRAEYSQAHAALRRSLSIAERIGNVPLLSYVFGNLGVLDARIGNLAEAETAFRQGIALVERIDDPVIVSILHSYLATVLQEQGKLSDAQTVLYRALAVGRAMHITPCIGLALITAGSVRIAQAMAVDLDEENTSHSHEEKMRSLTRAKKSLMHALTLKGIEAETRVEGQLALAQISLLLGEAESAFQQTQRTLEEARQFELTWLIARAQRLLGSILFAQSQQELAEENLEQALRTFRKCGMRLEYGRTLHLYGSALVQREAEEGKLYARGLTYLQEARQVFIQCKAMLDVRRVERFLAEHEPVKMK